MIGEHHKLSAITAKQNFVLREREEDDSWMCRESPTARIKACIEDARLALNQSERSPEEGVGSAREVPVPVIDLSGYMLDEPEEE